jgi:hypothetical protein
MALQASFIRRAIGSGLMVGACLPPIVPIAFFICVHPCYKVAQIAAQLTVTGLHTLPRYPPNFSLGLNALFP